MIIGVISDTHGLLRPEVINQLKESNLILHIGDIGKENVLTDLRRIAPVIAVRGNCDKGEWAEKLPLTQAVDVENQRFYLIHDIMQIQMDGEAKGANIVIFGHSHMPSMEYKENVHYLNPGSCGPRRFKLPVSMAVITIEEKRIDLKIIELNTNKVLNFIKE
ncbi:MAG: metallophosphoesterase family protein [Bacillota bacterium]